MTGFGSPRYWLYPAAVWFIDLLTVFVTGKTTQCRRLSPTMA